MDYLTKPVSRLFLRQLAVLLRQRFDCSDGLYFDSAWAFEKCHKLFPSIITEVVLENEIDAVSDCYYDGSKKYHIRVRQSVYEGACKGVGGYRADILHEICHVILFMLGHTPISQR